MRNVSRGVLGVALVLALCAVASAPRLSAADSPRTVSVSGAMQCAKCTLKAADARQCQDVLVVAGKDGGASTPYYVVKNAVAEKYGHVCHGTRMAVATGTVAEKDGKLWLTATKLEEPKG